MSSNMLVRPHTSGEAPFALINLGPTKPVQGTRNKRTGSLAAADTNISNLKEQAAVLQEAASYGASNGFTTKVSTTVR